MLVKTLLVVRGSLPDGAQDQEPARPLQNATTHETPNTAQDLFIPSNLNRS